MEQIEYLTLGEPKTMPNGAKVYPTQLEDCYLIELNVHGDHRGSFVETYNVNGLKSVGIDINFVQGNRSFTANAGTIRGLHFQSEPWTQAKLVECLKGTIYDVVVDVREGSPTYGKWLKVRLSEEDNRELYVPRGFLHGFVTVTNDVIFSYNVDNDYNYESDGGVLYNDPDLNVDWGVEAPILSEKDKNQPLLKLSKAKFTYRN